MLTGGGMKKYLFTLLFISFGSMACFGGHWESESKTSTFTIDLTETGDHISGSIVLLQIMGTGLIVLNKMMMTISVVQ